MHIRPEPGLTFADGLLAPRRSRRSRITSRSPVSTRTRLTAEIDLESPILSANMDTVTEAEMAVATARADGQGVIHRFMPIEAQAAQGGRVKRSEGYVVERPVALTAGAVVGDARRAMTESGIGGLVVVDREQRLAGILTWRDLLFAPDDNLPITGRMTPLERRTTGPAGIDLQLARRLLVGAATIEGLWQRAEFVRLTPAGQHESGPHAVTRLGRPPPSRGKRTPRATRCGTRARKAPKSAAVTAVLAAARSSEDRTTEGPAQAGAATVEGWKRGSRVSIRRRPSCSAICGL